MQHTKQLALMGLLLGIIVILGFLESTFVIPLMPPHARPGFANIIVMITATTIGKKQAITLNILKSLFVLITRGPIAGLLSLTGGVLSIVVIILLLKFKNLSMIAISVAGALTHSLGQFAVFMLLMQTPAFVFYLPVLLISGIISGVLTGTLKQAIMPILKRLQKGM